MAAMSRIASFDGTEIAYRGWGSEGTGPPVVLQHGFVVVIGLLPGIAAAFGGYVERLAFNAQARQYDRMRMLFGRAHDLLPETIEESTAALTHRLYQELGMEAMKENAEWVAIYRQRPIQPLQG